MSLFEKLKNKRYDLQEAIDDKGNMLAPILAIEALLSSDGKLPVNVKFFYEGQEEIGFALILPIEDT